jgi:hypothetical protein
MAKFLRIPGPVERHIAHPDGGETQALGQGGQLHLVRKVDLRAGIAAQRQDEAERQPPLAKHEFGKGHGLSNWGCLLL